MPIDVTIALLQFVALALPAMGIYMTFAIETRIGNRKEFHLDKTSDNPALSSPLGHSYHGMRVAVLFLLGAGICYFITLILLLPTPALWRGIAGIIPNWADSISLGAGILLTILSLLLFGTSIAFQQIAMRDELDVPTSLRILHSHTKTTAEETWALARNKEGTDSGTDED